MCKTLAFFTPNLQLCDFGFYGAVLELASKKVLRRAAGKRAAAKRRTGIRKEEKDGRNRNASGRKTVPGQNQHKQRTYPQKTSGEEKNGICPERHLFNSTDKKVPAGSPLLTHKMVSVLFILFHTEQGFIPSVKHFQPQKNGVHGCLLVANIAVIRTLFFFCNFTGGNGFRVFQQEHLLADGSSISMLTRRFNWKLREGLSFR